MNTIGIVLAAALATELDGSNAAGREKLCMVAYSASQGYGWEEPLKSCKRGDIIEFGAAGPFSAFHVCDFTKTVVVNATGSVLACVYTGKVRPVEIGEQMREFNARKKAPEPLRAPAPPKS